MNREKIKELVINGTIYAKYSIDKVGNGNILFLKVLKEIVPGNMNTSENLLGKVIAGVENTELTGMSYLNI